MQFLGYHGTSATSAESLLSEGVLRDRLPERGQIGPGFYIAKENTWLPTWAATQATATARHQMPQWVQFICKLTGYYGFPLAPAEAQTAILKVYATEPLKNNNWGIMNPPDLRMTAAMHKQGDPFDPGENTKYLQLCVPPEDLHLLYLKRDDGVPEQSGTWPTKTNDEPASPLRQPTRKKTF